MTEAASNYHVVQKPRKRADDVEITDFTMMVRVPGQPDALSVFTDSQADEAARYAADTGGTVIPLPLEPPQGYAFDAASGVLVPAFASEN